MAAPASAATPLSEARDTEPQGQGASDAFSAQRLLFNWHDAYRRALAYLAALPVDGALHSELARQAVEQAAHKGWRDGESAVASTLRVLRESLVGRAAAAEEAEAKFVHWRIDAALAGQVPADLQRGEHGITSQPPLTRGQMVPNHFARRRGRRFLVHGWQRDGGDLKREAEQFRQQSEMLRAKRTRMAWTKVAARRRALMAFLILIPSIIASGFMLQVLPYRERSLLEIPIVVCFGALFGWVSIGFWTATIGFFLLWWRDRFSITESDKEPVNEIPEEVRTAILMPICEEPVERIMAGLKATYLSMQRTGCLDRFDFFILSDTA
ncbi:MAG TPA: hypothetical protein VEB21_01295, partial [Terriglobales bacterium]|nr:hypothetical protein [Terriglobales bacterium]